MHPKLAAKDTHISSSQNTHTPPEPPTSTTAAAAPSTHTSLPSSPEIIISKASEEACPPKNSEPSSPVSEEEFSSGGEHVPFQDDSGKAFPPQFTGNGQYYMMAPHNGVSGAGADGGMTLPNAAWGGGTDVGMPEGMMCLL